MMIIVWIGSFALSRLSFRDWYEKVLFYGAIDFAIKLGNLSRSSGTEELPWWIYPFEFWWCFSMKYIFSWAIWWIMMRNLRNDLPLEEGETYYGDYHFFWQFMGRL